MIGDLVRKFRKEKNLTLEKFAKTADSSKSYIWEIENNPQFRPSMDKANRLALAMGVTVDYLLGEQTKESSEDQIFFCDYQKLKPEKKRQIRDILDVLNKDD